METIIGFVAGFLVGAREGQDGLERIRRSFHEIRTSPEVRRMAADALRAAEAFGRPGTGGRSQASAVTTMVRRAAGALGPDRSSA